MPRPRSRSRSRASLGAAAATAGGPGALVVSAVCLCAAIRVAGGAVPTNSLQNLTAELRNYSVASTTAAAAPTNTTATTSSSSTTTSSSVPANPNCTVRHCRQCDPSLPDQCMECEPPKLRELGMCRDECSKGYYAVHNMTDTPPDFPHCAIDCMSFVVTGIPSGPALWPAASSASYNTIYQSLIPATNQTGPSFTPAYADLLRGAYLTLNEKKEWRFVGLPAVCPNGTQQCNPLNKLAIGGCTSGQSVVRPQLCDQIDACTWRLWQCNCTALQQPCRCERDEWAQVSVASVNMKCVEPGPPVVVFPSPSPAPTSQPHSPSPDPGGAVPPSTFVAPLVVVCCVLVIGIATSGVAMRRRRENGKVGAEVPGAEDATGDGAVVGDVGGGGADGGALRDVVGSRHFGQHEGAGGQQQVLPEAFFADGSGQLSQPLLGSSEDWAARSSDGGAGGAAAGGGGSGRGFGPVDVKLEWQIPFERLTVDPRARIGSGGFGVVYRGKFDGIDVAVKKLERSQISSKVSREAAVLASLRHPHVVHLYGLSEDDYSVYIVMELCRMSLDSLMQREGVPPSRLMRLRIALQISDTMSYLHMKGVIHRDLKPENVLLHGSAFDVKICDFGLSKMLHNAAGGGGGDDDAHGRGGSNITLEIGTPAYMAPEMFVTDEVTPGPVQSRSVDGRKVDVYSFGILLYYLYTTLVPYGDLNTFQIVYRVKMKNFRPTLPEGTPAPLAQLVGVCWHSDPTQRPSFTKIHATLKAIKDRGDWTSLGSSRGRADSRRSSAGSRADLSDAASDNGSAALSSDRSRSSSAVNHSNSSFVVTR